MSAQSLKRAEDRGRRWNQSDRDAYREYRLAKKFQSELKRNKKSKEERIPISGYVIDSNLIDL